VITTNSMLLGVRPLPIIVIQPLHMFLSSCLAMAQPAAGSHKVCFACVEGDSVLGICQFHLKSSIGFLLVMNLWMYGVTTAIIVAADADDIFLVPIICYSM
jgi:hypothetical protein